MAAAKAEARRAESMTTPEAGGKGRYVWTGLLILVVLGTVAVLITYFAVAPAEDPLGSGETTELELNATYNHDASAFTQGLVFHTDGFLYESTGGYGISTVRRVEPTTGVVVQSKTLASTYFGEGLEIFNNSLYQLTWRSGVGFIYTIDTFVQLDTFTITTTTGQGWGIAHNGSMFIVSDGSEYLHLWNDVTMELIGRIRVLTQSGEPVIRLNELEYMGSHELLANVWFSNKVARIDLRTGVVFGWYDFAKHDLRMSSEDVLNGLAHSEADNSLYVTGKQWSLMYKMEL